jgi:inosine-uridine nucleoside N-ribohydrolase
LGQIPPSDNPVFVFTDPGIDDALALALVAKSAEPQLLGACGVDGNVPSRLATSNIAGLLRLFRAKNIPVFQSLVDDPPHRYATHVHGKNGLGNVRIVKPPLKRRQDLIDFLKAQGTFQILSLGPLTAVAQLLKTLPESAKQISRCVIMGGGFSKGNVTPFAEFNIHSNPKAADMVFRSSVKKLLIPLDVTEKVRLYSEDLAKLKQSRNRSTKALAGMLQFYFDFEKKNNGFSGGYMHDPSAFVAMIHPEFFQFRRAEVLMDTSSKNTRGRTTAKFSQSGNTWIALGVDEPAVRFVIMDGLLQK